MSKENEKSKKKPTGRLLAFRNEAIDALVKLEDESFLTPEKTREVAKLDCKKCRLHETTHNPKHQNCRDNPFCINRLGLEKFEKLINQEIENRDEVKKDQKRRDLNDQPAGLVNAGNYCYVNSFLQVWFNVPEFRQIVYDFRPSDTFELPPGKKMDIQETMLALQDIFFTLQTTPFNDTDKTKNLVKCLRLGTEQQDSQEFGMYLFNAIDRHLDDHPNGKKIQDRLKTLFNGKTCTRIVCKCGKRSENVETNTTLMLNIEGHSTLMEALDACFADECLDDYRCSDCGKKGVVTKQYDYNVLPTVIVIQLNRYKFTAKGRQKLKTPIVYPRELPADTFQRIDHSVPPPAKMYDLFAVTIHDGNNAECGHYYDLIKSPFNQKWYQYNDASVDSIAKPPGVDKPGSSVHRSKKEKEKTPADQKHCYRLMYRRRDPHLPLAHPKLPPDSLISESKRLTEESFEGQNIQKLEKSEKRVYDLKRRYDKLQVQAGKLETHVDKWQDAKDIAFLPTSLITEVWASEYEVAKGEKKKRKKEEEKEEDAELAAAIEASVEEQRNKHQEVEGSEDPQASTSATEEQKDQEDVEMDSLDTTIEEEELEKPKEIDIVAIAMEESELPTAQPERTARTTRTSNGAPQYVYTRSPRKSNGANGMHKPPVSSRVGALLTAHEMPICGHGKMAIDSILYGDVKAVARAPAIGMLREYDFRVKLVYENGQRVFPEPQKDREIFVFTAEDICMECVKEMRDEGIFNNRLDDDEKLVRKILKEEKQRCSVKCLAPKPDDYFYVAKVALGNFKKTAQTLREDKLSRLHTKKGTLFFDSVPEQKSDPTYPATLKRQRGRPRKSEVPEKILKLDESSEVLQIQEPEEDEEPEELVELENPREPVEFNAELRCAHGGINFSQFRHAVSPEEWSILKSYFDDFFEVKCSDEVCEECRRQEEEAQNGSDNMRVLVKEMRRRINDTLKKVEARSKDPVEEEGEEVKFGICSVFIDKLKKLTNRQSTSPPTICQQCLICKHHLPYKGFGNEDNQDESHVIGVTEEEWNTFLTEIRNLEAAGDEHNFTEPPRILISNGQIKEMCEQCFEQHMKFTEEQKYTFNDQPVYVKLVNPADEENTPKANGKSRRGRSKNVYSIKMCSSNKLMDLKVQLYDKTHQMPNDQLLYRTVGGEHLDVSFNQKTLFELRVSPHNNENPLILIAQQFSPTVNPVDETGDRAPERGFVDTALAH